MAVASHAVSRSSELLSCARTAVKIAKRNVNVTDNKGSAPWYANVDPAQLTLHTDSQASASQPSDLQSSLEDGVSLLRAMQQQLHTLQALVRRRGHTNDPTQQISLATQQLEQDARELAVVVQSLSQTRFRSGQQEKHLGHVCEWLQTAAQQQSAQLKKVLEVRGNVLADQAQRRKLLQPQQLQQQQQQQPNLQQQRVGRMSAVPKSTASSSRSPNKAAMDSPLFTMTQSPMGRPVRANNSINNRRTNGFAGAATNGVGRPGASSSLTSAPTPASATPATGTTQTPAASTMNGSQNGHTQSTTNGYNRNNGTTNSSNGAYGSYYNTGAASATSGAYGGYGGYANSGYGGASYGGATTGMRQRRPTTSATTSSSSSSSFGQNDHASELQTQILERKQRRQTQNRLASAQEAERTLADLGNVFGKMSTLIVQQGETVDRLEDDVEAAAVDVAAGQAEIQTLYSLRKGNRGLILKVFGILIFFIIFMRFYRK